MASFNLTHTERSWLQELVTSTAEARILRRAQALLWLAQGDCPGDVAQRLRVSRQTLYNWADRFHSRSHFDLSARLYDRPRSGRTRTACGIIDPLLDEVIDADPRDWDYRSTVWTAPLLQQYLDEVHDIPVSRQSVSAALDRLEIRWKRPRHCLGRRWTMALWAVGFAGFTSGALGLGLGGCLAEGGRLAFAGAEGFLELRGQLRDLRFEGGNALIQCGDESIALATAGTERFIHTESLPKRRRRSCAN